MYSGKFKNHNHCIILCHIYITNRSFHNYNAEHISLWIIFQYFSVIWETTLILLSGIFMLTFITDFRLYILYFRNFCHFTQYFSDHIINLWGDSVIFGGINPLIRIVKISLLGMYLELIKIKLFIFCSHFTREFNNTNTFPFIDQWVKSYC